MAGVQGFVGKSSEFFCTSIVNNLWLTNKANFFIMMQIMFWVCRQTYKLRKKEKKRGGAASRPFATPSGVARLSCPGQVVFLVSFKPDRCVSFDPTRPVWDAVSIRFDVVCHHRCPVGVSGTSFDP